MMQTRQITEIEIPQGMLMRMCTDDWTTCEIARGVKGCRSCPMNMPKVGDTLLIRVRPSRKEFKEKYVSEVPDHD